MAKVARLAAQIVPRHYRVQLDLQLTDFSVTAQESIDFELRRPARHLVFHGVGLHVASAQLETGATAAIETSKDDQTVTFVFDEQVPAGHHTLELAFTSVVGKGLRGLYRSRYEQDGQEKWLVTTQFEAVHAREAFVCIDEPAAKATFDFVMIVPADLTALSNMDPTVVTPLAANRKRVEFATTPKMSTYLAYLGLGEFEYIEGHTQRGTVVRVYATPGKLGQLAFALDTGIRCLEFYEDYFGILYPLPKLDMIAVPDFASGAMENWGAVTYRETALLLDPERTSLAQKQHVTEVIIHELGHQWFGNYATMMWWNDLWLNEGFASYMEVLGKHALYPEWQCWTQFVGQDMAWALGEDALANTHAIEVEVEDPRALDEIFDGISYSKGASIINMLRNYLGAEDFRRGVSHYLQKFQYSNAVTSDLWDALAEVSGKPVATVMAAWTSQPGYPVLSFANGKVSQQRFYASPQEAAHAADQPVWPVPLRAIVAGGQSTEPSLLEQATARLPAALAGADWFKPNPGQTGFYRTLYTSDMVQALSKPLTDGTLSASDRYGVVSDVLAGAQAGLIASPVALELLTTLHHETDYVVWAGLADILGSLLGMTEDEALRTQLEQFGAWFVQPALKRLGWEAKADESSFDTLLRPLVIQQAVRFDDEATVAEAKRRFQVFLDTGAIDPDLRPAITFAVARYGTAADFDTLLDLYRRETVPQVKMGWLAALGRFQLPELTQRSLELGLSADVRAQDTIYSIAYGLLNRNGRHLAWQFVQDNWPIFLERYGAGGHMLERFPAYVGQAFATHAKAAEVRTFFAAHPHPAITRPVAQAIESIQIKAEWAERDQAAVAAWLTDWHSAQ